MKQSILYQNPVIRGFNPDPSICRVGEDFFLVTSTFEYFPGVPVFKSRNLVNWTLTGHCLTTKEQLPLEGCGNSGGIYAPTIRWHDGMFYMTSTNASSIRNFIVHTDNLENGWSDPVLIPQTGIDPSLFFDDDGTAYYTSTAQDDRQRDCIQMRSLNPITGELLSDTRIITHGCGGCYPEGAHIYKRNGLYYLLLAEGGTEYGHRSTILRSEHIWGPYEKSPYNPLLHQQHLLGISPIQAVGHSDFVEDQNGNWWLVCLGIRPVSYGLLHNLGRETFLVPVCWTSDGWPVAGNHGTVDLTMSGPLPDAPQPREEVFYDGFDGNSLSPHWTFLRNPAQDCFSLTNADSCVLIRGDYELSTPNCSSGFMGIRQEEYHMKAACTLIGELEEGQKAGLCAYYTSNYHYEIYLCRRDSIYYIGVNRRIHDLEKEVFLEEYPYSGRIRLEIVCDEMNYHFRYGTDDCCEEASTGLLAGLCTEGTARMTFTGTFIGLFSVHGTAAFDDFEIRNLV